MPSASRPTFLRHFGRGPLPPRSPDLADMGTAFALDLSMDEDAHAEYAPRAHEQRAAPVAPWRLWLGRKLGS